MHSNEIYKWMQHILWSVGILPRFSEVTSDLAEWTVTVVLTVTVTVAARSRVQHWLKWYSTGNAVCVIAINLWCVWSDFRNTNIGINSEHLMLLVYIFCKIKRWIRILRNNKHHYYFYIHIVGTILTFVPQYNFYSPLCFDYMC